MNQAERTYRGLSADDRRRQRRHRLVQACLDLIGTGGTTTVTAESVAAQANLTKRYFYESFAGRDAILLAALEEMYVDLLARIRQVAEGAPPTGRTETIADVFVSALCEDPRRARLYAEAAAIPALAARREDAIVVFTDLVVDAETPASAADDARRRLVARIVVAGVTDVVTSWINGTLHADRATLTEAIVMLGHTGRRA